MSKQNFEQEETALGLTYNSRGVLWSPTLLSVIKPLSSIMFDWMHIYLVQGLWNMETGFVLKMLQKRKVTQLQLDIFVSSFKLPSALKSSGIDIFEKPHKPDKKKKSTPGAETKLHVKGSASEALGVFTIVETFLRLNVYSKDDCTPFQRKCCESYFALSAVLKLLMKVARGGIDAGMLHMAIVNHFRIHKDAFGTYGVLILMIQSGIFLQSNACFVQHIHYILAQKYMLVF